MSSRATRFPLERLRPLLLVCVLAAGATLGAAAPAAGSDILFVLDASGSMWGQIEGENKIVIARRVLGDLLGELPDDSGVGLIAYGHRREGDCADIEEIAALGPLDRSRLSPRIDALNPKGKTPLAASVERAIDVARGREGTTIALISDGLETCGGDLCGAVRRARDSGVPFLLHVIGFDLGSEDVSLLECAAQAGGGLYLSADDAAGLAAALDRAVELTAETAPSSGLLVEVVANGALHDAFVRVTHTGSGEEAGSGRTYSGPDTNPRRIPLEPGTYEVLVEAVGIEGDVRRRFDGLAVGADQWVERTVDYSSGELAVRVLRNGAPSDATVQVRVAGDPEAKTVARGRTYTGADGWRREITAGRYDVLITALEIDGEPSHLIEGVVVEPGGEATARHELSSGELRIGARDASGLVDALVHVVDASTGDAVARSRTYTRSGSNPSTFHLEPGRYRVTVTRIRGESRELEVEIQPNDAVERTVELP